MNEDYTVRISFREEEISEEEYNSIASELENTDEDIGIAERRAEGGYRKNSIGGAAIDIAAVSLTVSSTDLLLTIYQMIRSNPHFQNFSIQDSELKIFSDWDLEFHLIHVEHESVIDSREYEAEKDKDEKRHLVDTSKVSFPSSEESKEKK